MSTTQQILQAMSGLQSNAQSSLPVIPNNGNPGGANNMPQVASIANQSPAPVNPLQWLEPSPAMANVKNLLEEQYNRLQREEANRRTSEGQYNIVPDPITGGWKAQILDNSGLPFDETYPSVPIPGPNANIPQRQSPILPQGRQP